MSLRLKRMLMQRGLMDQAGDGTGSAGDGAGGGSSDAGAGDAGQTGAGDDAAGKGGDAGGQKKPSDEEARLLKENMKKKSQIDDLAKKLTDAQGVLKQLEELGGLDALKSVVGQQKDAEVKALEAKGDYERLKTRMAEEHSKDVKTLKEQIDSLQSQLGKATGTISELTIGTQFGQSKFISEELTLTPGKARVIYADFFDIEDGKVVGYDKPRGSAGRTALVDQYGNAVGFDDAIRKIVEADPEKDHLMKSKIKAGADSVSRKPSGEPTKDAPSVGSVSKIASGLKGLKIS